MKRLLSATAALAAVATIGSAGAADLPIKAPRAPVVAPIAYTWTGCFLGVGGGYGMWLQKTFGETDPGHVPLTLQSNIGGSGWFGTGQAGCDYQFNSSFVIGAFADFDFGSIKGDVQPFPSLLTNEKESSAWAAGARVGWVALPQLLTYVSGGWTQARFDAMNWASAGVGVPPFTPPAATGAHTYSGWFIGTGYEYGLSFLPGLFWKTEYRFSSYRADDLSILQGGLPSGLAFNSQKNIQTIRSELVWRFNWGGQVVAKY
jgi:outer membrane immunogenic protein